MPGTKRFRNFFFAFTATAPKRVPPSSLGHSLLKLNQAILRGLFTWQVKEALIMLGDLGNLEGAGGQQQELTWGDLALTRSVTMILSRCSSSGRWQLPGLSPPTPTYSSPSLRSRPFWWRPCASGPAWGCFWSRHPHLSCALRVCPTLIGPSGSPKTAPLRALPTHFPKSLCKDVVLTPSSVLTSKAALQRRSFPRADEVRARADSSQGIGTCLQAGTLTQRSRVSRLFCQSSHPRSLR